MVERSFLVANPRPPAHPMGKKMANSIARPQYVSFDCYGTLINFDIDPTTRRLLAGRLPEEQWPAFKKVFRG